MIPFCVIEILWLFKPIHICVCQHWMDLTRNIFCKGQILTESCSFHDICLCHWYIWMFDCGFFSCSTHKTKYKIDLANPKSLSRTSRICGIYTQHEISLSGTPGATIGSGINSNRITTQPKDTTIYTVKFTNEYGCEFTDSFMVIFLSLIHLCMLMPMMIPFI